jgi:hypothetical protein
VQTTCRILLEYPIHSMDFLFGTIPKAAKSGDDDDYDIWQLGIGEKVSTVAEDVATAWRKDLSESSYVVVKTHARRLPLDGWKVVEFVAELYRDGQCNTRYRMCGWPYADSVQAREKIAGEAPKVGAHFLAKVVGVSPPSCCT